MTCLKRQTGVVWSVYPIERLGRYQHNHLQHRAINQLFARAYCMACIGVGAKMTRHTRETVNHVVPTAMPGGIGPIRGKDHVCVLLSLSNGADTIGDLFDSLANQTHTDWSLIISDDGSRDNWLPVVSGFTERHAPDRTWLLHGPQRGAAQNYLSLLRAAGPMVPFAAFCHQDDVWLPGKLARALSFLSTVPEGRPGLYCARSALCDQDMRPIGQSPDVPRPPAFANALVQNIGCGNTMVLNRAALDLLQDTAHLAKGVTAHDWWAYQLVSGAGGIVQFDASPTLLCRRPDARPNTRRKSYPEHLKPLTASATKPTKCQITAHTLALARAGHWLSQDALLTLASFQAARSGPLISRLRCLRQSRVYRQSLPGTVALWTAAFFNRL